MISLLHATAVSFSAGSPGTLVQDVDLTTGFYRQTFQTGPFAETTAFDGTAWTEQNGISAIVDVPALVADQISSAYLLRVGWQQPNDRSRRRALGPRRVNGVSYDVMEIDPPGGSHIEAWFNARSHVLARAIVSTDTGPDRIDYSDYRRVGAILWAFRQHEISPTGTATDTTYRNVRVASASNEKIFAMPTQRSTGMIDGSVGVRFHTSLLSGVGFIISPIRVRGGAVNAIFDTGGQNAMDASAAQRLGRRGEGGLAVGGSGAKSETALTASVGSLHFANGSLPDQRFFVLPFPYVVVHPMNGVHVGAIVGAEIMASFRVVIDYAHRLLTLQRFGGAPPAGTALPFVSDGSHMYVEATIDGARGLFGIDTGDMGGITVFEGFARRHRLFRGPGIPYLGLGIGGTDREFAHRGRTFELAGYAMADPVVRVAQSESGAFSSRSLAGNLGVDVLSRFLLTIDYHARTIGFAPNTSLHVPFRADRTGLSLYQQTPDAFVVLSVAPATPAARAGVRIGDAIIGVDGCPVSEMGLGGFDPYRFGSNPFTLTIHRKGTMLTLLVHPRSLLPVRRNR